MANKRRVVGKGKGTRIAFKELEKVIPVALSRKVSPEAGAS